MGHEVDQLVAELARLRKLPGYEPLMAARAIVQELKRRGVPVPANKTPTHRPGRW